MHAHGLTPARPMHDKLSDSSSPARCIAAFRAFAEGKYMLGIVKRRVLLARRRVAPSTPIQIRY
jgi:hypothetical protein